MTTAIEFNNISKQYRLGLVSTRTLSHDLDRWWKVNVMHKEDPYLKIGSVNDRSAKADSEYVWALKDIDFKVEQGDVVGIIGKNGAGKSTLLKLLSKVTGPTTGTIRARGRIGSLLEVGTGFHQEMTGRENIYLNGAILGMTKQEVARKLDEIVDFSGCERYLDTPVKRYSSGMTVRLGFAVAAHLEPEILVVDEVLAVGDAEFQKKAIGKMQDVAHGGRTVLFVSHNMGSIRNLCMTGVLLENGMVKNIGNVNDIVDQYLHNYETDLINYTKITSGHHVDGVSKELEYLSVRMFNDAHSIGSEETLEFEMQVRRNDSSIKRCKFGFVIRDCEDSVIGADYVDVVDLPDGKEVFNVHMVFPEHHLAKGKYKMNFNISCQDNQSNGRDFDIVREVIRFEVNFVDAAHQESFVYWSWKSGICYNTAKVEVK